MRAKGGLRHHVRSGFGERKRSESTGSKRISLCQCGLQKVRHWQHISAVSISDMQILGGFCGREQPRSDCGLNFGHEKRSFPALPARLRLPATIQLAFAGTNWDALIQMSTLAEPGCRAGVVSNRFGPESRDEDHTRIARNLIRSAKQIG